jgi:hypothetical protein
MVKIRVPERIEFEQVPEGVYPLEVRFLTYWRRTREEDATDKRLVRTENEAEAVCVTIGALPTENEILKLREEGLIAAKAPVSRITSPLINISFYNPETAEWLSPWRSWIRPILGYKAAELAEQFIVKNLEFNLEWLLGMYFRAKVYLEPRLVGGFWSRFRDPSPSEAFEEANLEKLRAYIEARKKPEVFEEERFASEETVGVLRGLVAQLKKRGVLSNETLKKLVFDVSGGRLSLDLAKRKGKPLAELLYPHEAEILMMELKKISDATLLERF